MTPHDWCRVSPFGHPRINVPLPTPQGLSQARTSFIGSRCQGIHHVPFIACHTTTQPTQQHKNATHTPPKTSETQMTHPRHVSASRHTIQRLETTNRTPMVRMCGQDARIHYPTNKQPEPPNPPHQPGAPARVIPQGPTACDVPPQHYPPTPPSHERHRHQ